ncbi:hypothetical protein [Caenispirillum salinarum]|uniref:hypothetical protein n=1 Tax=Caenispirillum salinarum TaxID=859058 RepID=UPI00384F5E10
MSTDWIDLNRSFVPHRPADERETAAFQSYFRAREHGPLDWPRLLEHGRVVVLGEAGSGKTCEFQAQTNRLRESGRTAFFLRVEQLADTGVEGALDPSDLHALRAWRSGDQPATLFLDAVEEARLSKHTQFETALRSLAGFLGDAVARCSIVLSSRITGWHADDADIVSRLLGAGPGARPGEPHPDLPEGLAVVELAALNTTQIRQLADQETDDPDAFLDAIEQRDAWDFAGRPYDVLGLLRYWTTHGALGSLTEIIEDDVARKLREDNPNRHHRAPLTPEKARQGAEALAAASVLSRRLTFAATGAVAADGTLDPEAVLAEWKPDEVRALLERPVFDEAAFERVRFHHRHVSEYLAAGWLKRLLDAGAPRQAVAGLLFRPSHGRTEVVPDALAPVAAWLAGKESWVRKRLMAVDPDVLLEHGDPSAIPPEERAILLKRLMEHHRFRPGLTPTAQLHRLADPSLGPAVAEMLRDPELSADQKELLLRLVAIGRLPGASTEAAKLAADRTQPEGVRRLAVEAVAMAGGR